MESAVKRRKKRGCSQAETAQLTRWDRGIRGYRKTVNYTPSFKMLMSGVKPQVLDIVLPQHVQDTVYVAACAPCALFEDHTIKPRFSFLQDQPPNLPSFSIHPNSQMSRHGKGGPDQPKDSQFMHHGMNNISVRGGNGPLLTGEAYSTMLNSPFSSSQFVSLSHHLSNPRTDWTLTSNSNALLGTQSIVDPASYSDWQQHGPSRIPTHVSTFASAQPGTNHWQHHPDSTHSRGTEAQMLNYNPNHYYKLGEDPNSSFSSQTSLGPGYVSHGMPLSSTAVDDDLEFINEFSAPLYDSSSSFSSTVASDSMEAMMLKDSSNSVQSPWNLRGGQLGAESGLPCISRTDDSVGVSPTTEQLISSPSSWEVPTMVSAPQPTQTVSPKLLRIRPTPTPTSSSESIRTSFLASSREDVKPSLHGQLHSPDSFHSDSFHSDSFHSVRSHASSLAAMDLDSSLSTVPILSKPRKTLPDRAPSRLGTQRYYEIDNHENSGHANNINTSCRSQLGSPLPSLRQLNKASDKVKADFSPVRPLPVLSPAPPKPATIQKVVETPFYATDPDSEERRAKDQFLIDSKNKGMTYKQIRQLGGFTEAESTLRGRYRTLTKSRDKRVRKPEWSEMDVILLEKAVREYARDPSDPNSHKIPWKKVGEYIDKNGGTYHFGNSTCRKRWDDLVREQTSLGRDIRRPFYEQASQASFHSEMAGGYHQGYMMVNEMDPM